MYTYIVTKNDDVQRKESGSALVVTMIVLAILTVLGMAALDVADVNILISANDRDIKNAYFLADSGSNIAHVFVYNNGEDLNATRRSITNIWRNETVSQFNIMNSTLSFYESGTKGTYVRFGVLNVRILSGISDTAVKQFMIRSHTYGQKSTQAEVDLGWNYYFSLSGYD